MNDHSITLELPRITFHVPNADVESPLPARLDCLVERNRTQQVVDGLFAIGIAVFTLAIGFGLAG